MSADRPHFIIIGAMKCATSTLHEQLARQPGVFMSTPKEPNFFSDDEQWARGIAWYRNLFAGAKPDDICGESSTHYTKLPTYPRTIDRMRECLPADVKFIYVMRHPIDRLVSHYIHEWTQRVVPADGTIDAALDTHPELIAYSRYAMQLRPFFDAFSRERVLPVFFERLTSQPQQTLERVCRFIGYDRGPVQWFDEASEQNVSSERMRQSPMRDAILSLPGVKTLRRTLIPRVWRDRVKRLWMMKQRPALSEASVARLRKVFDEDLATLGAWLGHDNLRCDNFKQFAQAAATPMWTTPVRTFAA